MMDDEALNKLDEKAKADMQRARVLKKCVDLLRPLSPVQRLEVIAGVSVEFGAYDVAERACRALQRLTVGYELFPPPPEKSPA